MDYSPAYRQEHALLTVEELCVMDGFNGGDLLCSLTAVEPITVDYSMVKRLDYTWTSDARVTVHHAWSSLMDELQNTKHPDAADMLTQTPFDYLQHGGIQPYTDPHP